MIVYLFTEERFTSNTMPDPILCAESIQSVNDILDSIKNSKGYTLFLREDISAPDIEVIRNITRGRGDCWHSSDMLVNYPGLYYFNYIKPCWMLNALPAEGISYINWRITFDCFLLRNNTILSIGLLQEHFQSIQVAAMDWGYRAIQKGVIPVYRPCLFKNRNAIIQKDNTISLWDQLLFIKQHSPARWQNWALFRINWVEKISLMKLIKEKNKQQKIIASAKSSFYQHTNYDIRHDIRPKISVILITLGRYKYIDEVIDLLQKQTLLPYEIIIVDGTPVEEAGVALLKKYSGSTIPVIVERAITLGQCSQRNQAIVRSKGDYLFFIDDDMVEVKPDHLAKHWENMKRFKAGVSSGMPDEVGIAPLDRKNKWVKVSDVFPTNDSLVNKLILIQAGLFDIKMDRGQSEDHELGIRLFKSGALMVQDPAIQSLHLRALSGGLRTHDARKVTYSSARNKITHRRLPHMTEFYLSLKHHKISEVDEMKLISAFGTFSMRGNILKKILKVLVSILYLPQTLHQLNKNISAAKILLIK